MVKLLSKSQTLEAQKSLLEETIRKKELLNSKIISSLQPRIGKQFENSDTELQIQKILRETRKKLIQLAIDDKEAELQVHNEQFEQMKQSHMANTENVDRFYTRMDALMNALAQKLNTTMNKKISFHIGRQHLPIEFVKKKTHAKKKRRWTANRKRKNRVRYKKKVKEKKKKKLNDIVSRIKENNTVINLSTEDVPDATYIFLSKGLGYVPSQKVDTQDLKYDATEFIRKVSWRAFFTVISKSRVTPTQTSPALYSTTSKRSYSAGSPTIPPKHQNQTSLH